MSEPAVVDFKMIRDTVVGAVSFALAIAIGYRALLHCTVTGGVKDCYLDAGWIILLPIGLLCWSFWLWNGDKFKEFGTWFGATVRGQQVVNAATLPIPQVPK